MNPPSPQLGISNWGHLHLRTVGWPGDHVDLCPEIQLWVLGQATGSPVPALAIYFLPVPKSSESSLAGPDSNLGASLVAQQ